MLIFRDETDYAVLSDTDAEDRRFGQDIVEEAAGVHRRRGA